MSITISQGPVGGIEISLIKSISLVRHFKVTELYDGQ